MYTFSGCTHFGDDQDLSFPFSFLPSAPHQDRVGIHHYPLQILIHTLLFTTQWVLSFPHNVVKNGRCWWWMKKNQPRNQLSQTSTHTSLLFFLTFPTFHLPPHSPIIRSSTSSTQKSVPFKRLISNKHWQPSLVSKTRIPSLSLVSRPHTVVWSPLVSQPFTTPLKMHTSVNHATALQRLV